MMRFPGHHLLIALLVIVIACHDHHHMAHGIGNEGWKPSLAVMTVSVVNDLPYIVDVEWAAGLHDWRLQGSVYPNEEMKMSTFEGHVLIVRCQSDKLLVRTIVADSTVPRVYASGRDGYTVLTDEGGYDATGLTDADLFNLTRGHSLVEFTGTQETVARAKFADTVKRPVLFYNDYEYPVKNYWVSHTGDEVFQHRLEHGWDQTLHTYPGHVFLFRNESNGVEVSRLTIASGTRFGLVNVRRAALPFQREYERHMGRPWLTVYPRPLPVHTFHPLVPVNSSIVVSTTAPQWMGGDMSVLEDDNGGREEFNLTLTLVSRQPRVFEIKNFLSPAECDHIISLVNTTDRLKRSTVTDRAVVLTTRTSANAWMNFNESPVVLQVYRRGFAAVNIPFDPATANQISEALQVLRYEVGQKYTRHQDWFPALDPGYLHDAPVQRGHNRFATLFLYLNDVDEGGETEFPRFNGENINDACNEGFRVAAKRGDAVIFYTVLPDGNVDLDALHGGCPVKKGTKYGANWWFWEPLR